MATKYSRREMNILIRVEKRKRLIKKTSTKTYKRPEGAPVVILTEKENYA
jgi:hypothetical protein